MKRRSSKQSSKPTPVTNTSGWKRSTRATPSGAATKHNARTSRAPRSFTRSNASHNDPPVANIGSRTNTVDSDKSGNRHKYVRATAVSSSRAIPKWPTNAHGIKRNNGSTIANPARNTGTSTTGRNKLLPVASANGVRTKRGETAKSAVADAASNVDNASAAARNSTTPVSTSRKRVNNTSASAW